MEEERRYMEELFRLYYRPLCLYALHFLDNTSETEDLVQECFTSFLMKYREGAVVRSPKSYLFGSVRNRCLDTLRKGYADHKNADAMEMSDEEEQERAELEARLWTAVDRLPSGRRRMLIMSKRDGMKYSEIADRLGVSERTVKNQISRALKSLREGAHKLYLLVVC